MKRLYIIFLMFQLTCHSQHQSNESINYKVKNKTLYNIDTTKCSFDSNFSLNIYTKSVITDKSNHKKFPSIVSQKIAFKFNNRIKYIEAPLGINKLKNESEIKFLKYQISEVSVVSQNGLIAYSLYLFSANGESEYYYYYNLFGEFLFFQKCTKKECNIICNKIPIQRANLISERAKLIKNVDVNGVIFQ